MCCVLVGSEAMTYMDWRYWLCLHSLKTPLQKKKGCVYNEHPLRKQLWPILIQAQKLLWMLRSYSQNSLFLLLPLVGGVVELHKFSVLRGRFSCWQNVLQWEAKHSWFKNNPVQMVEKSRLLCTMCYSFFAVIILLSNNILKLLKEAVHVNSSRTKDLSED